MNTFENMIYALYEWQMDEPQMYGWFHLMWLAILIAAITLICVFRKRFTPKTIDIILIIWGVVLIVIEAIKLVLYSFHYDDGAVTWAFDWGRFPFQFCSSPLYVAIPAGVVRQKRIKDALCCFLATFSLFGGLISMFFPSGMFAPFVFISIHTMVWHASMVAFGIMLYITNVVKPNLYTLLKGFIIYIIFVLVAFILNLIFGHHQYFNMFYISPFEVTPLEVYNIIYQNVPYPIFLLLYILGFTIATTIVTLSAIGINILIKKILAKKNAE